MEVLLGKHLQHKVSYHVGASSVFNLFWLLLTQHLSRDTSSVSCYLQDIQSPVFFARHVTI